MTRITATLAALAALAILILAAVAGCSDAASADGMSDAEHDAAVALGATSARYAGDDDEDDDGDDEVEEQIPLSEVPEHVKDAAIAAVPGLVLEEAVREHEGDTVVYELEGEADGQEYEVEVSADGKVLEIETDEADDDDD